VRRKTLTHSIIQSTRWTGARITREVNHSESLQSVRSGYTSPFTANPVFFVVTWCSETCR